MRVRSLTKQLRKCFARKINRATKTKQDYLALNPAEIFAEKFEELKISLNENLKSLSTEEHESFSKGYEILKDLNDDEKTYLMFRILKERNVYGDQPIEVNLQQEMTMNNSFDVFKSDVLCAMGSSSGGQSLSEKDGQEKLEEIAEPEEKKVVDLAMESYDTAQKLKIIKELKNLLGLGLKDAKELLEKGAGVLKEKVDRSEAETMQEKLSKLGCVTTLK